MIKKTLSAITLMAIIFLFGNNTLRAQSLMVSNKGYTSLKKGSKLTSANGQYYATFQTDGNFCIYKNTKKGQKYLWCAMTNDQNALDCRLQSDGRLTVLGPGKKILWSAGSANSKIGYQMDMQDDGNLCIYAGEERAFVWCSNTAGK